MVYFIQLWGMLAEAMSKQTPPARPPPSPLPCHLWQSSFMGSKLGTVNTCTFGTSQSPKQAGHHGYTKAGKPGEVMASTHETLAPRNMIPQSVLIPCSNLCFLQTSAVPHLYSQ